MNRGAGQARVHGVAESDMTVQLTFTFSISYRVHQQKAELDESEAEIKISGENINNLRYADDTTLWQKVKKKLKSLLMKVEEVSEKLA